MKNSLKWLALMSFIALCVVFSFKIPTRMPHVPVQVETTVVPDETTTVNGKKLITIKPLNLTKANVTHLTSEVTSESVNKIIEDINKFNYENNNTIFLLVDSPGGSVIDGAKLVSVIEASKNPVTAINIGSCASMCFIILEHSHTRLALNRTTLMGHPASLEVMFAGELDKVVSRLSYMKRYVDKMDVYIAKRAGMTYESFKLLTQQELWIDAVDAKEKGFLDDVVSVTLPGMSLLQGAGTGKLTKDFKLE